MAMRMLRFSFHLGALAVEFFAHESREYVPADADDACREYQVLQVGEHVGDRIKCTAEEVAEQEESAILHTSDESAVKEKSPEGRPYQSADDKECSRYPIGELADEHRPESVALPHSFHLFEVLASDPDLGEHAPREARLPAKAAHSVHDGVEHDVACQQDREHDNRIEISEKGERASHECDERSFHEREWDNDPVAILDEKVRDSIGAHIRLVYFTYES